MFIVNQLSPDGLGLLKNGSCAARSGWNARQPEIDRLKKICEDMLDAGCFTESEVNDYRREIEGYPEALEGA